MKLITWNVQWCRGVDGKVDPSRIVKHAKMLADFDILCLQEVANNYADPRLPGSRGENQFAELARLLPGYAPVPGVAVDVPAADASTEGPTRRFVQGRGIIESRSIADYCCSPVCLHPALPAGYGTGCSNSKNPR